jgi:superfamily I DNA and/or RNA helicase
MERNIVIVSTVRSNRISDFPNQKPDYDKYGEIGYAPQSSLGFAQFPNRLNVALSRAKRLLVIVGNAEHFEKMSIYRNVLKTIRNHPNGRVINFTDIKKIG